MDAGNRRPIARFPFHPIPWRIVEYFMEMCSRLHKLSDSLLGFSIPVSAFFQMEKGPILGIIIPFAIKDARFEFIVLSFPRSSVGTQPVTSASRNAERSMMSSHAERGNYETRKVNVLRVYRSAGLNAPPRKV